MMCTIMIGLYSSVQGQFVKRLQCGRVAVRVGETIYTGHPVSHVPPMAGAA